MISVNLELNSIVLLTIETSIKNLNGVLVNLGNQVIADYNVLSTSNKVPTDNDPNGEFVFNCTEGVVKITTKLSKRC